MRGGPVRKGRLKRAAALANDIAEARRVRALTPRQQAPELIASQYDTVATERR
jgi:hypothetical protein